MMPCVRSYPREKRNPNGGAVLIIVLMVMLCLWGLGITALWMTSGNLAIGANINLRTQALYAAEAGVEQARQVLNGAPPTDPAWAGTFSAALNAALAGTNPGPGLDNVPTGVDADGFPNGLGALLVARDGTVLANRPFPPTSFGRTTVDAQGNPIMATMGTYTVWIRNDTAEIRRGAYVADTNQSVVIRSRGVAVDKRTTVILEVSIGASPGGSTTTTNPFTGPPRIGYSGKNSMDDSNSVLSDVVVGTP